MIVSYKWLADYLGENIPSPEKIEELLTFHAFEIEGREIVGDDVAIDVKVLPNRGSDCLSHRGIARELASITGAPLMHDPLSISPEFLSTEDVTVTIADSQACPRFAAVVIKGVEVKESPAWLRERLTTLGQRSINNIVDATNYVMYALGQPLHAYDADLFPKVEGAWRFGVRFGQPGEKVALLAEGGKTEDRVIVCTGTELLIVDESSNTPIGLAGVKGGSYAGVHKETKNIIVEAAHFDPVITRRTARRLGIVIDASKRFENRPSPVLPPYALRECASLISKIAGGELVGGVDANLVPYTVPQVTVSPARVNALLGLSLSQTEVRSILERAGISVEEKANELLCTGPIERTDLLIEADFIEEVARLSGFSQIASVVPKKVTLLEYNARHYYSEVIRDLLTAQGFSEVITSSFRNDDEIQLLNAMASDKSCLRSNLTSGLAEALYKNAGLTDLLGTPDTRIFEIGTTFHKDKNKVREELRVALGVRTRASGYTGKDDVVLNESLTALREAFKQPLNEVMASGVAEFNFSNLLNVLPVPANYADVLPAKEISFRAFSVYPTVSRDIAFWVREGAEKSDLESILQAHAGKLLVRLTFLDEFHKEGRVSFAFRLVFQAVDRTLTDAELEEPMRAITIALEEAGAEVR